MNQPTLQQTQDLFQKVTNREIQIVELLAQGLTNREIAGSLGLSPRTIEKHRDDLYKRTDCRTSGHLVATFIRAGVIS